MADMPHRYSRQASRDETSAPSIAVRYFYESLLVIDDPLSPVPAPQPSASSSSKLLPRPFSIHDNIALDRAWNDLRGKLLRLEEEKFADTASVASREWKERRDSVGYQFHDVSSSRSSSRRGSTSRTSPLPSRRQSLSQSALENATELSVPGIKARLSSARSTPKLPEPVHRNVKDSPSDGLTARPFARLPSRKKVSTIPSSPLSGKSKSANPVITSQPRDTDAEENGVQPTEVFVADQALTSKIAVGVSRLHQVVMPQLTMEPIYWSPVHDIAAVFRGTWFYKHTMLPVEVEVANMLEAGYLKLRPWTQTWSDELASATDAGAIGEEKILHRLWPEVPRPVAPSRPSSSMGTKATPVQEDPEKVREDLVEAACNFIDTLNPDGNDYKAAGLIGSQGRERKRYLQSSIIYANEREAYILRPNLQPSAYFGRRPLANYIRKGHDIGICVVRGFDQSTWNMLNPPKSSQKVAAAYDGVAGPGVTPGQPTIKRSKSGPDAPHREQPQVTDLILVIHGIGQKLSERLESFHFTHAMNSFRREVNVEVGTPQVKPFLRRDMGSICVLPCNWRSTLAFEDGGYRDELSNPAANQYTLQDITPETLPNIRNIISDVMLDIPYYLSHHQPKMIAAVIHEANRIHRLWCQNNPGFETYGRVHLIAHSLGSVMAIDILSKQPTFVTNSPSPTSLSNSPSVHPDDDSPHFRFNTANLYLAGSPAGFFLLLKGATLLPRRNRDNADSTPGITNEQGTYGCIAVDNIYNIINPYDPVAYRLNACVDAAYSAALRQPFIPSSTTSWLSLANPFRTAAVATPYASKPHLPPRMPSNVELETHNFTAEEIAEKRVALLNDNGQIDFFLRYGGGPLDIQYLTMLGAHSSYWTSRDFVRFIVLETGRAPGREGTLEAMRAVKKKVGAGAR